MTSILRHQEEEAPRPWHDISRSPSERASALLAEMTLSEKTSQLVGLWVGADASGGDVAPQQGDMAAGAPSFSDAIVDGLGQLTRPYGTAPVQPDLGSQSLARAQRAVVAANRFGIPAQVHEECLAGLAAWGATAYPVPLSWGASFDPDLVAEMAAGIGRSMRALGVHQGLAPVLDVVRDYRWGRVEETIGEDPYLVASIGSAYVRGLESAGIVATLKHFAGYSGSAAGRNHAPVSAGVREMGDVFLPPFEAAIRLGGARSVMNSYAAIDGVPPAADPRLLSDLLRERWGFGGVVVADYFSIAFLRTLQGVAATDEEAATLALTAGVDVELPSVSVYGEPLLDAVASGALSEDLVDRAALRVLTQKAELGLLDPDWRPVIADGIDLDDAGGRELALKLARESVVLLDNRTGLLPLPAGARVAVIGPLADDPMAMLGCYSFPAHVGVHHPESGMGIAIPTVLQELIDRHNGEIVHAQGCDVMAPGRTGFAAAAEAAQESDVVIVVVGDRAGLFGRGTSGEGCDATDLRLPGEQHALVSEVIATGTPVVLLVLSGRPYALGDFADDAGALVQTFLPGQLGGQAIAEILTGAVQPSGRLPVGIPRDPGGQPATYLAPPLGRRNGVSNIDPTPLYPFGHGRGYSTLHWGDVRATATTWPVDATIGVTLEISNPAAHVLDDVIQLYLHDQAAEVVRPDARLIGFARVSVPARGSVDVTFTVHADLASFVGRDGDRVVEPGAVELRVSRSSADVHATIPAVLTGTRRPVGADRVLLASTAVVSGGERA